MKIGNILLAIFLWFLVPVSFFFGTIFRVLSLPGGYNSAIDVCCTLGAPLIFFILGIIVLLTGLKETPVSQPSQQPPVVAQQPSQKEVSRADKRRPNFGRIIGVVLSVGIGILIIMLVINNIYGSVAIIRWLFLFIIAFLPPIVYVTWIRNTERYYREPWKPILLCFLWGASVAAIASLILNTILGISLTASIQDYTAFSFITAVVIAPIVEEFTKPLVIGLKTVRKELDELEDGLIYGASAGLGFSATENLFYESTFLSEGLVLFFILVIIRTIGGCLLHASATALTGYGYSKSLLARKPLLFVVPYFILAIVIHAFYNFIASFEIIGGLVAIAGALIFAIFCIRFIRKKIRKLDKHSNTLQQTSKKEVTRPDRRCPSCDRVIPFDANICPYCGKKFKEFQQNTTQNRCTFCGFEIQSDDIFCGNCGKKIKE